MAAGRPVVVVTIESTNRAGGQAWGIRRSKAAEQSAEGPQAPNAHPEASRVAPADAAGRGYGETRNVNVESGDSHDAKRKGPGMTRGELVLDFYTDLKNGREGLPEGPVKHDVPGGNARP